MQARSSSYNSVVAKNGASADKFTQGVDAGDEGELTYNLVLHVQHTAG